MGAAGSGKFLLTRPSQGVTLTGVGTLRNQHQFLLTRPSQGVTQNDKIGYDQGGFLLTRPSQGVTIFSTIQQLGW